MVSNLKDESKKSFSTILPKALPYPEYSPDLCSVSCPRNTFCRAAEATSPSPQRACECLPPQQRPGGTRSNAGGSRTGGSRRTVLPTDRGEGFSGASGCLSKEKCLVPFPKQQMNSISPAPTESSANGPGGPRVALVARSASPQAHSLSTSSCCALVCYSLEEKTQTKANCNNF